MVATVVAEPRLLVVRVVSQAAMVLFVVAHAPHINDTVEKVSEYWKEFECKLLAILKPGEQMVLLIDANAQLRAEDPRLVKHADFFRHGLETLALEPVVAWDDEPLVTYWYSEVAGVQIDYIAASGDIMVFANTAATLDDFTPAVQGVDHVPVAVEIELRVNPCAIAKFRRRMPFDRSELAKEDVARTIRAGLAALPVPDRTFEQSTRCHIVNKGIMDVLKEAAPVGRRKTKKPWITDEALALIDAKIDVFKWYRAIGRSMKRCMEHGGQANCGVLLDALLLDRMAVKAEIDRLSKAIALDAKQGFKEYIEGRSMDIASAADDGLSVRLHRAVKLLKPRTRRPLVTIRRNDGTPTAGTCDKAKDFKEHLAVVTQGTLKTFEGHLIEARRSASEIGDSVSEIIRDAVAVVGATDFRVSAATAPSDKRAGPHLIPSDM